MERWREVIALTLKRLVIIVNGVDKEETAILKHISDNFDRLLEIISKPQSKVTQIFNFGAAIVGILGILAIVDLIVSWIKG